MKPVLKHISLLRSLKTVVIVADCIFPRGSCEYEKLQKCIKDVLLRAKVFPEPVGIRLLYKHTAGENEICHDYLPDTQYGDVEVYLE